MMRALRQGFRCRVRDRLKNRELAAAWTDLSEELQAQSSGVARVRNPARCALMARLRVGAASAHGVQAGAITTPVMAAFVTVRICRRLARACDSGAKFTPARVTLSANVFHRKMLPII